jgi:hypothetical protein
MKREIALLNLQVDANFGGHLQRFALITILQRSGYEVIHLNTRFSSAYKSKFKLFKGGFKRLILYPYIAIFRRKQCVPFRYFKYYLKHEPITEVFYDKYVPATKRIYTKEQLSKYSNYDTYIVGSDQVWRKCYSANYGIFTFLLDFVSNSNNKIVYGASFGTDKNELTNVEIERFRALYAKFSNVSVREFSALNLLKSYGCLSPEAEMVLDPTLLLTKEDYNAVINSAFTKPLHRKIFCYILDLSPQKLDVIHTISRDKQMDFTLWCSDKNYTVEQWLRSFRDAEYIITDSYHGLLFSLIFNKKFRLLYNEGRGNARFDSVIKMLGIKTEKEEQDYSQIEKEILKQREKSINFIINSLV